MDTNKTFWDNLYNSDERTATATLQGAGFTPQEWLEQSWQSGLSILRDIEHIINRDINTILDLGCGSNGRFLIPFAQKGIISIGIDHSRVALEKIQSRIKSAHTKNIAFLCQGDIGHGLFFKDNAFDVILSQGVICHIPYPGMLLKEMAHATKINGIIFCGSFLNKLHPAHLFYYFINKIKQRIGLPVTPFYYWKLCNIKNMFESAGLKIIRINRITSFLLFYDTICYPRWALKLLDKFALLLFRIPFKYEIYAQKYNEYRDDFSI